MIEKLKEVLGIKKKKVLVLIHGFGVRAHHEFDLYLENQNNYFDEIKAFDMFDVDDPEDHDHKAWIKRCELVMKQLDYEKTDVYLLGFSMGGVIASYLASVYPVKKVVLVAPAFIHFSVENYTNLAIKGASKLVNKNQSTNKSLPNSFYQGFLDLVSEYKNSIAYVECPVLILHGDHDEIIPLRSAEWGYENIPHDNKRLVILHRSGHKILDDTSRDVAYELIEAFYNDKFLQSLERSK